jgi:YidC/Oxa1 family membrane protein insertase
MMHKMPLNYRWLAVLILFGSCSVNAIADDSFKLLEALKAPGFLVNERIQESHMFYGMASYYNAVNYYIVDKNTFDFIDGNEYVQLGKFQWLAVVGRFNVLLVKAPGLSVRVDESKLQITNPEALSQSASFATIVSKSELSSIAPELDQIRYSHLWAPFAWFAKLVESALVAIQSNVVNNWGLAIVVFTILLKILMWPIGVMTVRFQQKVSQVQAKLAPQLVDIKAKYDGEEAHNRIMEAHKKLGVSPFYTLKPMLSIFIQVPIWIAVFNALGEMPQLIGQSFLWIKDLAYPDTIGHLPSSIPMFGDTISLLPFVMTAVTLLSTFIFQNRHASESEIKRQKRNLYLMAAAFLVLFYSFPAAMVIYWTLANFLQIVQQKIIKI